MAGHRRASTRSVPEAGPVRIERIGAEGDGIGELTGGGRVYVPGALPGESVIAAPARARGDGWLAGISDVVEASPERVVPLCGHFGICGGCALQHWGAGGYRAWKAGLLRGALERAGFTAFVVDEGVWCGPHSRRRMDLAVRRLGGRVVVGLHEAGGPGVVDLRECWVLRPELVRLIEELRPVLAGLGGLRREGSVVVNLVAGGADLLLRSDGPLSLADRQRLGAFAAAYGVARVCWAPGNGEPEPVIVLRPVVVDMGGVAVSPPPGGFLQATREGETAIVGAVLAGLPERMVGRAQVAELYAGCGTLTFPLAGRARVVAWEGDGAAVAAASEAARRVGKVEVSRRDLARQPVSAAELKGYAGVVLDQPFTGAGRQMEGIATSGVGRVVYVSCNPAALARDAGVLRNAGYGVARSVPIDQFLWSPRLESVTVFELS